MHCFSQTMPPAQPFVSRGGASTSHHSIARSIKLKDRSSRVTFVTDRHQQPTAGQVAQLLSTSTGRSPDILHGSLAQAAQVIQPQSGRRGEKGEVQVPNIVLFPPATQCTPSEAEGLLQKIEKGACTARFLSTHSTQKIEDT